MTEGKTDRKLKRGERTRTGKDKPIGAGAGAYLWTLRDLQGMTREQVEEGVARMLGKATKIGHATIIGIERGARMPSYDIIGGLLRHLKGDWDELFDLMQTDATEEDGKRVAERRAALIVAQEVGLEDTQLDQEQLQMIGDALSDPPLLKIIRHLKDYPEHQPIVQAVLDSLPKPVNHL